MRHQPSYLRPGIFLDRDGVINANRPDHVKAWAEFQFLPGALEALRTLAILDRPIIVVSNQAVIGRRQASVAAVEEIHSRMVAAVAAVGGRIDATLYCPHRPDEGCACRKPQPGLLYWAAIEWNIDLARSHLVGDAETDILAAHAAGCQPILVQTGRGADQIALLRQHGVSGFRLATDLVEATKWIVSDSLSCVLERTVALTLASVLS